MAFTQQKRDLGMVMKETDENLAIFLGMLSNNDGFVDPKSYDWLLAGDDAPHSNKGSPSPCFQPVTPPTSDTSAASNRKPSSPATKPRKTRSSSANSSATIGRKSATLSSATLGRKPASITTNRPASTSRGRPDSVKVKPRQHSCSPTRLRDSQKQGIVMVSRNNRRNKDDLNPVLIGSKMVERVVNMRKLAPPKQEETKCLDHTKKGHKETCSGFGRSLSKKSLEMAIRHMDIRRSIPDDISTNASSSSKSSTDSFVSSKNVKPNH